MSTQGLSQLIAALMAAGNINAFDMTEPRLLHRAVTNLARSNSSASESILRRFDVTVRTKPDPEVGLRVHGLTKALWDAVAVGLLEPAQNGRRVWVSLTDEAHVRLRMRIEDLPREEALCLYGAGAEWACASTKRKNARISESVGAM